MAFGDLLGTKTGTANSITNPFAAATGTDFAVAVGDLIVAVLGEQTSLTVTACGDNLHGASTYTAVNAGTDGTSITGRCFYKVVTVAGTISSVSFVTTASADNVAAVAAGFAGPFKASPLDAQPANNNNSDNASPFTCPATGTLAQASELVIAWMCGQSNATWLATSPNLKAIQAVSQSVADTILGYQAVSSTSSVAPEFTGTNPTASVQGTASFMADTAKVGQATFPGSGLLSALAQTFVPAAATLPGLGSLRASAATGGRLLLSVAEFEFEELAVNTIATRFAGAGGMSVAANLVEQATVAFGGLGGLQVYLSQDNQAAATFSGAGSLSVSASFSYSIAAQFDGAGGFSAAANLDQSAQAQLSGLGTFSVYANLDEIVFAIFGGEGIMSVAASIPGTGTAHAGAVNFAGAGSFRISGSVGGRLMLSVAEFEFAEVDVGSIIRFNGIGNVSVYANLDMQAAAIFGGAGSMSVELQKPFQVGAATFEGVGSLSVLATLGENALATLNGTGGMSVRATLQQPVFAQLDGSGALQAYGNLSMQAAAIFGGTSSLRAVAGIPAAATIRLDGSGAMSAYANLRMRAFATFGGVGSLRFDADIKGTVFGNVIFSGVGSMQIYANSRLVARVQLGGAGGMSVLAGMPTAALTRFAGFGSLSANAQVVKYASVVFSGSSGLQVATRANSAALAVFNGQGGQSCYVNSDMQALAVFAGAGNLRVGATGGVLPRTPTRASIDGVLAQPQRSNVSTARRQDNTQTERRRKAS